MYQNRPADPAAAPVVTGVFVAYVLALLLFLLAHLCLRRTGLLQRCFNAAVGWAAPKPRDVNPGRRR